jgi:hypothetical protein
MYLSYVSNKGQASRLMQTIQEKHQAYQVDIKKLLVAGIQYHNGRGERLTSSSVHTCCQHVQRVTSFV